VRDSAFLNNLNEFKPSGYPAFTHADVLAAEDARVETWQTFNNDSPSLCMDINGAEMNNACNNGDGTYGLQVNTKQVLDSYGNNVGIWEYDGGTDQRWTRQ